MMVTATAFGLVALMGVAGLARGLVNHGGNVVALVSNTYGFGDMGAMEQSVDIEQEENLDPNAPLTVTAYVASWCPACRQAEAYMTKHDIPYRRLDITNNPAAAKRLRQLNPRGNIPTLVIDGTVLAGFDASQLQATYDAKKQAREQKQAEQGDLAP